MNFMVYDLILLVVFIILISFFLYRGRKNLRKEGILLLYKTKWGINLINKIGKKYQKTLKTLSYVSITLGYVLMAGMLYLLGKIVWIYLFQKEVVQALKVPPIMPLIPYLPQAFKLDWLPPFYFTYWILIIAIIAITHEFAHGIFAVKNKIRIKNTGFGFFPFFLPIFLAAFVEPDEKQMQKKKKFSQLAVLSAGTFANIVTAIVFFGIFVLFFILAFSPAGVVYNNYVYETVSIAAIASVNGFILDNPSYDEFAGVLGNETLQEIKVGEKNYVGVHSFTKEGLVNLYLDAPAINAGLESVIFKINNVEVKNMEELAGEIYKHSPGDNVTLNVLAADGEDYDKDITLEQHPLDPERAWLGIGFAKQDSRGIMGKISAWLVSFKNPHTYYQPKLDGVSVFVYHLLWWIIIISISVALINMLPVGIFDGGRVFYLTALAITKSEKKAKKAFNFITYLIIFAVILLMVSWLFNIF